MLTLAVIAAVVSLFITPPTKELWGKIDWHTLGMLLMMLCVLEGFKKESVLNPVISLASKLKTKTVLVSAAAILTVLAADLIYTVFFR